mgnify:CR=1 FL=1
MPAYPRNGAGTEKFSISGVTLRPDMRVRHLYEYWPADHPVTRRARRFDIVTAASLVMRRADFLEAGAFDEEFRNGFEDVELCSRLVRRTLERGKRTPEGGLCPGIRCLAFLRFHAGAEDARGA